MFDCNIMLSSVFIIFLRPGIDLIFIVVLIYASVSVKVVHKFGINNRNAVHITN